MIEQSFKCPKCSSKHTSKTDNGIVMTFCRCCGTRMLQIREHTLTEWGN